MERICKITDSQRSDQSVWESIHGPISSRTSRMEAAAWIAVTKYHCHVVGLFVRDWVVCGIDAATTIHLYGPSNGFNIKAFFHHLQQAGFEGVCLDPFVENYNSISFQVDRSSSTGPFLIKVFDAHVAVVKSLLYIDCLNLACRRDVTKSFASRINIVNFSLAECLTNILHKQFKCCGTVLSQQKRAKVQELENRGWKCIYPKQIRDCVFVPYHPGVNSYFAHLDPESAFYKTISENVACVGDVIKVKLIYNDNLSRLYSSNLAKVMASIEEIKAKKPEAYNSSESEVEELLYHGTGSLLGIRNICHVGFDDRYGRNFYFFFLNLIFHNACPYFFKKGVKESSEKHFTSQKMSPSATNTTR